MQNSDKISILALIVALISLILSGISYYDTSKNIEQENPKIHYSVYQYVGLAEVGFYSYRLDIFNSGRSPCFNTKLVADYRYYNFFTLPGFSQNIESKNYSFLDEKNDLLGLTYENDYLKRYYLLYYILPKEVKTVYFYIKTDEVKNDEKLNITLTCDNIESENILLPKKHLNDNISKI